MTSQEGFFLTDYQINDGDHFSVAEIVSNLSNTDHVINNTRNSYGPLPDLSLGGANHCVSQEGKQPQIPGASVRVSYRGGGVQRE